jgi:uncharacterized protein (TIGR02147 family)
MGTEVRNPIIFEYTRYRDFLRDLVAYRKATQPQFSFRYFSRMAGFTSPNFLKLVIEGDRNLSSDSIDKFARALKLGKEETAFFRNLVLLNQAGTLEERKYFAEQVVRSKMYRKMHPLREAQFAYYNEWYYVPIRELVDLPDFREDPAWIASRLVPAITAAEAHKALEALLTLGLVRRDGQGRLRQTESFVTTEDDVASAAVAQFHREMIRKGAEAIERFPGPEREISAVTLGLSTEGARQVKELIQRFRHELLAIARQDTGLARVYEANFQFFPLSKKPEDQS